MYNILVIEHFQEEQIRIPTGCSAIDEMLGGETAIRVFKTLKKACQKAIFDAPISSLNLKGFRRSQHAVIY